MSWTIDKQPTAAKIDLPLLPERLISDKKKKQSFYDFPILSGYEFWSVVAEEKFVSYRIPQNTTQDNVYINPKGIRMYKSFRWCPRSVCGVELIFHTFVENGNRQLFVTMAKSTDDLTPDDVEFKKETDNAFNSLEQLADSLTF